MRLACFKIRINDSLLSLLRVLLSLFCFLLSRRVLMAEASKIKAGAGQTGIIKAGAGQTGIIKAGAGQTGIIKAGAGQTGI